ncbi:MAG TPA: Nramp family divalent metal transporter [Pyrinomonadaceae bacterium]|nr:Nramp family divalent metal transporter [Pyrinomonadaceae bacterium]
MIKKEAIEGFDPIEDVERVGLIHVPKTLPAGMRINIRGRSIYLRGLRLPPKGIWKWLLILGPGLIATSAGNDAGGIATYSSAGAKFGYNMIWVMVVLTLSFAVVQEMCTRLGAATGRGLLDLIRERFGVEWTLFAIAIIVIANGGVTISEFVGIGAASELLGVSRYISVPIAAVALWYLVIFGSYARVEKIFLLMTLVFFAYPIAAIMGGPDWGEVAKGTVVPTIKFESEYIFLLVGVLGTTITPYIQIFQQSSTVERGAARKHYGSERLDAYAGSVFSNLMSISMIIATAATLYVVGQHDIQSAADAARALEPVAGSSATLLFAVGLLGASLLAGGVLPLATSYAVSEAFGIPKGVNLDYRRGREFFLLFTAFIILGAGVALIPGIPIFPLLVGIQVLNGVLLPIILVFLLLLINDERLVGDLKNTPTVNLLGWGTFAMITIAVTIMLLGQLLELFGVDLFG